MSARRSRRSTKTMDKDVSLSVMTENANTPRKMSRELNGLLTSTPDKRESKELERRSSSAQILKRQSRKLLDDLSDGNNNLETGEQSIHSKSQILNHDTSMFDDKPKHLYGLDNPADISADKEFEQTSKTDENTLTKPVIKTIHKYSSMILFTCLGFCLLAALVGIINDIHHQKQQHDEDAAEIELLKNRISKLERMQSNQGIKTAQDHTYQKVFLRDQTAQCDVQQTGELMEQALWRWDADKIGIPDYALESSGGQIHSSYHSATFSNGAPTVLVFGVPLWYDIKTARVVIQPGNNPGDCWAFQGSAGFVVIKLSQMIKPSSFTLEHMAASLSQFGDQSIPSAPKEFSVWGWSDAHGNEKTLLGEYVYDDKGYALQSFSVQASTVPDFRFIELRVHSNYGNPSYTCLYRFRVHGSPRRSHN